jgi:hypothetical protein
MDRTERVGYPEGSIDMLGYILDVATGLNAPHGSS